MKKFGIFASSIKEKSKLFNDIAKETPQYFASFSDELMEISTAILVIPAVDGVMHSTKENIKEIIRSSAQKVLGYFSCVDHLDFDDVEEILELCNIEVDDLLRNNGIFLSEDDYIFGEFTPNGDFQSNVGLLMYAVFNDTFGGVIENETIQSSEESEEPPSLYDLYTHYLIQTLNELENTDSLREYLDICEPNRLYSNLEQGVALALEVYPWIGQATRRALQICLSNAQSRLSTMRHNWREVDSYEKKGFLAGMATGALSKEQTIGATIGTFILPGIGTVLGGAIGGYMAGAKEDDKAKKALNELEADFHSSLEKVDSDFTNFVDPCIEEEINRAKEIDEEESCDNVMEVDSQYNHKREVPESPKENTAPTDPPPKVKNRSTEASEAFDIMFSEARERNKSNQPLPPSSKRSPTKECPFCQGTGCHFCDHTGYVTS